MFQQTQYCFLPHPLFVNKISLCGNFHKNHFLSVLPLFEMISDSFQNLNL